MSEGNFSIEPIQKRVLRYDPRCLDAPYEGMAGQQRLQEMADREGLILLPIRFVDRKDGLPVILAEHGGGFPGTLREWYAGMALQGLLAGDMLEKIKNPERMPKSIEALAFSSADMMLAESKKGNT